MKGLIRENKELHKHNQKLCSVCGQVLPLTEFGAKSSKCKPCYNAWYSKDRKDNPQRYEDMKKRYIAKNEIFSYVVSRLSDFRSRAREFNVPFDLTSKYLEELWNDQSGKCYYDGTQLKIYQHLGKPTSDSASLDRLIPSEGYVQGNVVWCSYWVNTAKGELTELEFRDAISRILNYSNKAEG
uniref:Uncharacterized protein n=1 Tax=viral metagenome TaxID=1070528 RepID=A0A6M3KZU2_9ZZZZ